MPDRWCLSSLSASQLSATPFISPIKILYYQDHHKKFTRLRPTTTPCEFTYTRCERGPLPLCNTTKFPELRTFLQSKGGKNLLLLWTYKKKNQQASFFLFCFPQLHFIFTQEVPLRWSNQKSPCQFNVYLIVPELPFLCLWNGHNATWPSYLTRFQVK